MQNATQRGISAVCFKSILQVGMFSVCFLSELHTPEYEVSVWSSKELLNKYHVLFFSQNHLLQIYYLYASFSKCRTSGCHAVRHLCRVLSNPQGPSRCSLSASSQNTPVTPNVSVWSSKIASRLVYVLSFSQNQLPQIFSLSASFTKFGTAECYAERHLCHLFQKISDYYYVLCLLSLKNTQLRFNVSGSPKIAFDSWINGTTLSLPLLKNVTGATLCFLSALSQKYPTGMRCFWLPPKISPGILHKRWRAFSATVQNVGIETHVLCLLSLKTTQSVLMFLAATRNDIQTSTYTFSAASQKMILLSANVLCLLSLKTRSRPLMLLAATQDLTWYTT